MNVIIVFFYKLFYVNNKEKLHLLFIIMSDYDLANQNYWILLFHILAHLLIVIDNNIYWKQLTKQFIATKTSKKHKYYKYFTLYSNNLTLFCGFF